MEPYELPFGGIFDLNRDGFMNPAENALAYMVVNELMDEDESEDGDE